MRLFIAEKPKMAAALAAFLPGPHSRKDGYIETGGGYVTWCVGHILQQAGPEAYGEQYKTWDVESLPILPSEWKMEITADKRKQVSTIRDLLKKCSSVVNAGDPGREGQLIVDEVLEHLGNRKPVERILLAAWDKASVLKALSTMQDNRNFHNLYLAALGRQRADWLVGMNLTRAYSVLAQRQQGRRGSPLSVGRVQTPTLAIVCRRDEEIENFIPKDYWSIQAQFVDANQPALPFWAKWLPKGVSMADLDKAEAVGDGDPVDVEDTEDEEDPANPGTGAAQLPSWLLPPNRILDKAMAEKIANDLRQAGKGQVTRYENKPAKESPPLPYDATTLQALISNRHGISVPDVLKITQELYEKGFTTYPRTDCSYLPMSQHDEGTDVLTAIAQAMPDLGGLTSGADPLIKSRAFNDEKVGEHHAIIPTREAPDMNQLSENERHVYRAVCLQYIAQFYPDCLVDKAVVEMEAGGHRLVARGRIVKSPGWRVVFGNVEADDSAKKTSSPTLPTLAVDQELGIQEVKNTASQTKPPPRFREGTLLKAMQHVDRLVTDPEIKKKLKAMDGIGRTATRPAIMETLFKRTFLAPQGKYLISTPLGRAMVKMLPEDLTNPALSARWETVLDAIADGRVPLTTFEERQKMWVTQLVQTAQATPLPQLPASEAPAYGGKSGGGARSSSGPRSSGSGTGAGKSSGGASKAGGAKSGGKKCPKCGKGEMRKREIKQGQHAGKSFLGCSNYPECKHSEWPK